jgi:thioester reductase-like protein
VCGDVSEVNLKLSIEEYLSLSLSISYVFHCAAEVNNISTLSELYAANVEGK